MSAGKEDLKAPISIMADQEGALEWNDWFGRNTTLSSRIGTSWKSVSAAIASVEPVRTWTWNGNATRVIWLPIPEMTWPDQIQR